MCFWAWIFKNLDTLERLHVDCRLLNRQHQQICHWLQHPSKATRQDVGIGITHLHDMWFCSKQKDSFLVLFFSSSFWISWAKINFQTYIYILYLYTCVHHVFLLPLVKVQVRHVRRRLDLLFLRTNGPSKGWPFPESRRSTVASPLDPTKTLPTPLWVHGSGWGTGESGGSLKPHPDRIICRW